MKFRQWFWNAYRNFKVMRFLLDFKKRWWIKLWSVCPKSQQIDEVLNLNKTKFVYKSINCYILNNFKLDLVKYDWWTRFLFERIFFFLKNTPKRATNFPFFVKAESVLYTIRRCIGNLYHQRTSNKNNMKETGKHKWQNVQLQIYN
jgi:hypothetical protein